MAASLLSTPPTFFANSHLSVVSEYIPTAFYMTAQSPFCVLIQGQQLKVVELKVPHFNGRSDQSSMERCRHTTAEEYVAMVAESKNEYYKTTSGQFLVKPKAKSTKWQT